LRHYTAGMSDGHQNGRYHSAKLIAKGSDSPKRTARRACILTIGNPFLWGLDSTVDALKLSNNWGFLDPRREHARGWQNRCDLVGIKKKENARVVGRGRDGASIRRKAVR